MTRAVAFLLAALFWALPAPGAAFSDPDLFGRPATEGGGGGRYFTGSPLDGQSCAVCHRGGTVPTVAILGLPEAFDPGLEYQVTVRWAHPEISHSLQLELLTEQGQTPIVTVPAAEALSPGARCSSEASGDPAVYQLQPPRRSIVGVRDCFASEVVFRFVAPDAQRLYLSASVMRSDSSGTLEGDGVFDVRHTVVRRGTSTGEDGGCALSRRGASGGWLGVLALMLMMRLRKRVWLPLPLVLCGLLSACYQPDVTADLPQLEEIPLADAGSVADAGVVGPSPSASVGRTLMFRVRTKAYGGRYAPKNIGAIWVEDERGRFVKTLERWALTRVRYLRSFQAASQGDVMDAITSATLNQHVTHEVTWNLATSTGMSVPHGEYRIVLEQTDLDGTGVVHYVPFTLGAEPLSLTPPDAVSFVEMSITLR